MPITQRRMIAVINSGKAFEYALKYALDTIEAEFGNAECGLKTHEEARKAIMIMVKSCTPSFEVVKALTFEEMHFTRYGRRNEAEAKRHARRRARKRGESVPPSTLKGGNHNKPSLLDEQWGEAQSSAMTPEIPPDLQAAYDQWNRENNPEPKPPKSSQGEFNEGLKEYAPKMTRGNIEITRTVKRGASPTDDPAGPPPSIDLDADDGDIGL